jgi:exodeoxyribonuclease VII large subunit
MSENVTSSVMVEKTVTVEAAEVGRPSVLSVQQLNLQIKQLVEGSTGVVWVQAEISNFKAHTSGHHYFSLKDKTSQISAVMFRGNNSRLKFRPEDGMEVLVRGRISVYEPRGSYQIVCDLMEPVGAGALQKAFEQLKEKLKKEGLFESARKRAIPAYPRHVAIVTSPTGAAIRDMMNVLGRRARGIQITVIPTLVQGAGAAEQIVAAMKKAWMISEVDVIIVGRGGGSIEDLWAFNDETLARTIVASPVPVISAVGHEIDFTISDFVADLRAPTPSAAAELVAKSSDELMQRVLQMRRLLILSKKRTLDHLKQTLTHLRNALVDPQRKLQDLSQRNDELLMRLDLARSNLYQRKKQRLEHKMSLLDSLSPLRVVDRGYALVTKSGQVVKTAQDVIKGDELDIRLSKGSLKVNVESILADSSAVPLNKSQSKS